MITYSATIKCDYPLCPRTLTDQVSLENGKEFPSTKVPPGWTTMLHSGTMRVYCDAHMVSVRSGTNTAGYVHLNKIIPKKGE